MMMMMSICTLRLAFTKKTHEQHQPYCVRYKFSLRSRLITLQVFKRSGFSSSSCKCDFSILGPLCAPAIWRATPSSTRPPGQAAANLFMAGVSAPAGVGCKKSCNCRDCTSVSGALLYYCYRIYTVLNSNVKFTVFSLVIR